MQRRWQRIWYGLDLLMGAWTVGMFWGAFHGHPNWFGWWFWGALLYMLARMTVFAWDHVRSWRLWALFDFAVFAIAVALCVEADFARNETSPWGIGLMFAILAFVTWRAKRFPRTA